jgi:hypothetical protein
MLVLDEAVVVVVLMLPVLLEQLQATVEMVLPHQ